MRTEVPDDSPPTPGNEVPLDLGEWRFEIVNVLCETTEMYRPGGYHPVIYGDKFCEDTYTIIRKLGYGPISTVWLARDSRYEFFFLSSFKHGQLTLILFGNDRYVALKILTAKASTTNIELEVIQHLSQTSNTEARSGYIINLLDTFTHDGPNGKHRCLVFEPMGPSTAYMVEKAPEECYLDAPWTIYKYPKLMARRIISDTLHGLAFLHENNIVHGNIEPGNLLFCIRDIDSVKEDELQEDETDMDKVDELRRIDGKTDKWGPKYAYLDLPLRYYAMLGPDTNVKISGLGSAFCTEKNTLPSDHLSPITALRAPEMILGEPFDTSIDIWALGCLLFQFLTDRPLFLVSSDNRFKPEPSPQKRDLMCDDHLLQFNDIIGKLPDGILKAWPPITRQPSKKRRNPYDTLEVLFAQNKPDEIDDTESAMICSLIRKMLIYSPAERPSATELLKHPWFST